MKLLPRIQSRAKAEDLPKVNLGFVPSKTKRPHSQLGGLPVFKEYHNPTGLDMKVHYRDPEAVPEARPNPYLEKIRETTKHHFEQLNHKIGTKGVLEIMSNTLATKEDAKPVFNYSAF